MRIVLASGSPRRAELLTLLGHPFEVVAPDVDETPLASEDPVAYVKRVSAAKVDAVAKDINDPAALFIGGDTTVDIDERILAKPTDADNARAMLQWLSGRSHMVHTGVTVQLGANHETDVCTSSVKFAPLTSAMLEWYIATGDPFDKAGGYGLQTQGSVLVESVEGNVANILGLPIPLLIRLCAGIGAPLLP